MRIISKNHSASTIRAEVVGQQITATAEGVRQLILRLSDELLDLDQPVSVTINGQQKFQGQVKRTVRTIWDSLNERADPRSVATGVVDVSF